jgi:hypothetical protein
MFYFYQMRYAKSSKKEKIFKHIGQTYAGGGGNRKENRWTSRKTLLQLNVAQRDTEWKSNVIESYIFRTPFSFGIMLPFVQTL